MRHINVSGQRLAIFEADHANTIIAAGRADLCAIARPHLANPAWTLTEAAKIGYLASHLATEREPYASYSELKALGEHVQPPLERRVVRMHMLAGLVEDAAHIVAGPFPDQVHPESAVGTTEILEGVAAVDADRDATARSVERLMGNKAEARFEFIQERAAFADAAALDV